MSLCVCTGALMKCAFGTVPVPFNALPVSRVMVSGRPAGAAADMAPIVNIPPFGLCQSLANPMVAAATAAALGVLTPMPCIPVPAGGWLNTAPKLLIGGQPALTDGSKLMCAWGGAVTVQFPGQVQVTAG